MRALGLVLRAILRQHNCNRISAKAVVACRHHEWAPGLHTGLGPWQQPTTQLQQLQPSSSMWQQPPVMQAVRAYSQCDCPTLGGPVPEVIAIEYDEEEVDRFIALADAIEEAHPNIVVEGNPDEEGRPGAFEIKAASGALLFSRLQSSEWPDAAAIVDTVTAVMAAAAKDGSSDVIAAAARAKG